MKPTDEIRAELKRMRDEDEGHAPYGTYSCNGTVTSFDVPPNSGGMVVVTATGGGGGSGATTLSPGRIVRVVTDDR
jgi:hypothetical protein